MTNLIFVIKRVGGNLGLYFMWSMGWNNNLYPQSNSQRNSRY